METSSFARQEKVQNVSNSRKVFAYSFCDSQELLLEHWQERCSTANSACYSEMLRDKLKPTIWSKWRKLLSEGVTLLHDSACPHTAAHTVDTLKKFNNRPTRCDLFSLLYFCRQLCMFQVLTPIIRSSYNCNYSFWYWLTGSTAIRSHCWVGTDSVPTQQRERMVVDPVNQYQKL